MAAGVDKYSAKPSVLRKQMLPTKYHERRKNNDHTVVAEKILWMTDSEKLHEHVHMQGFPHLRLNNTKISTDVAKKCLDPHALPQSQQHVLQQFRN